MVVVLVVVIIGAYRWVLGSRPDGDAIVVVVVVAAAVVVVVVVAVVVVVVV